MTTVTLIVRHPDGQITNYDVGPYNNGMNTYKSWAITPDGLVIYKHNGNRVHILPGSMYHVEVVKHG